MNGVSSPSSPPKNETTDRAGATPADFGDSDAEYQALSTQAAWRDFGHAGCVALSGPERIAFFGGLITQQVRHVSASRSVYAAMLSPQGRYLWDFTLVEHQDRLLLMTGPDRIAPLVQQIALYILRAKVQVTDASADFGRLGVAGPEADQAMQRIFPNQSLAQAEPGMTFSDGAVRGWRDPRHSGFGWRLLAPMDEMDALRHTLSTHLPPAGVTAWEAHRIGHGLPQGGHELRPGETLPLEARLHQLNGVDFAKGCYIGQETTARTHHRGTLKKGLFQVTFPEGTPVNPGDPVQHADGKEAGIITSSAPPKGIALALLRLESVAEPSRPLNVHDVEIKTKKPAWAS